MYYKSEDFRMLNSKVFQLNGFAGFAGNFLFGQLVVCVVRNMFLNETSSFCRKNEVNL